MNFSTLLCIILLFITIVQLSAQVGIGTNSPNSSSILHLKSSNKALVLSKPNISSISNPIDGMLIYDENNKCLKYFRDSSWSDCLKEKETVLPDAQDLTCGYTLAADRNWPIINQINSYEHLYVISIINNGTKTYTFNNIVNQDIFMWEKDGNKLVIRDSPMGSSAQIPPNGGSQIFYLSLEGIPNKSGTYTPDSFKNGNINCPNLPKTHTFTVTN
ncbi:hypothetical protein UJ101_01589 [Flavobacteriaceae bacterium UJ101]|nr:hypothetical protein UJ101_01589 [Flavobacteriaceae bacterium UJ101]